MKTETVFGVLVGVVQLHKVSLGRFAHGKRCARSKAEPPKVFVKFPWNGNAVCAQA